MLNKVSQFFNRLIEDEDHQPNDSISLEIACAVLLCEVMRADHHFAESEQSKLVELLQSQFHLSTETVNDIFDQALQHSEQSNDLYTYTSLINKHYQIDEKIALIKLLWQLALADGEIAAIEQHIIRKIADLLHLRHSEYISTKPLI